jgi:cytochrome c553
MSRYLVTFARRALVVTLVAIPLAAAAADVFLAGDAKRGAALASACQGCHGANGEGVSAAGYPRLAAQTAGYLEKQLNDFVNGSRDNPVMAPIAKGYNEQQRADLAAYYASSSTPEITPAPKPLRALFARGRLLARTGDDTKQLQACANCHGPDGGGEPFTAPYLAGQGANYLVSAIKEWKSGARTNDSGHQMAVVANRLDEEDISAIAAYFEHPGRGDF